MRKQYSCKRKQYVTFFYLAVSKISLGGVVSYKANAALRRKFPFVFSTDNTIRYTKANDLSPIRFNQRINLNSNDL